MSPGLQNVPRVGFLEFVYGFLRVVGPSAMTHTDVVALLCVSALIRPYVSLQVD